MASLTKSSLKVTLNCDNLWKQICQLRIVTLTIPVTLQYRIKLDSNIVGFFYSNFISFRLYFVCWNDMGSLCLFWLLTVFKSFNYTFLGGWPVFWLKVWSSTWSPSGSSSFLWVWSWSTSSSWCWFSSSSWHSLEAITTACCDVGRYLG